MLVAELYLNWLTPSVDSPSLCHQIAMLRHAATCPPKPCEKNNISTKFVTHQAK